MSGLLGRIGAWLIVRQVQIESKKNLTRENADRIRTAIINRIIGLYRRALIKTPNFTGDDDFCQFAAWVLDGKDGDHRLQNLADTLKRERRRPTEP